MHPSHHDFHRILVFLGFRDKDLSSRGHRVSNESLNQGNRSHSRNLSDGSGSSQQGVPQGTRVAPLGRETTPTPNAPQRIPREVWDRFEGKTREVSIPIRPNSYRIPELLNWYPQRAVMQV